MIVFKPLYSVVVGVVLTATAMGLLYYSRVLGPVQPGVPAPAPTATVLVAASDIPFGMALTPEAIMEVQWPKASVPAGAVAQRSDLLNGPEGKRVAIRSLVAGEPFLKAKVSGFGEKPSLSRRVSPEMRAYSISISDVSGVAGFLMPGDRVDVLLTRQWPAGSSVLVSDVLLQNVTVLGIDQLSDEKAYDPVVGRTATVEVARADAQKLALAAQLGSLSLTLRNSTDAALSEPRRVSAGDFSGASRILQPAPEGRAGIRRMPAKPIEVTVRRGMDVRVEQVAE